MINCSLILEMLKRLLDLIRSSIRKIFLLINRRKRVAVCFIAAILIVLLFNWLFASNITTLGSYSKDVTYYSISLDTIADNRLTFLNDKFSSSKVDILANVWLYSALPDYRASTESSFTYRIIAAHNTNLLEEAISYGTSKLYCHFWLVFKPDLQSSTFSYQVLISRAEFVTWKDSGKLFTPFFINCAFTPDNSTRQQFVAGSLSVAIALSSSRPFTPAFLPDVLYVPQPQVPHFPAPNHSQSHEIVWCLAPLYALDADRTMARQLLEAIELNRVLGVSHLVAYVHSSNASVSHVLRHYERIGFATRVEMLASSAHRAQHPLDAWSLQELALQHCLLRSLALYRYAINTDLDDFLVPAARVGDLADFVRALAPSVRASAYMFRHVQLLPAADPFFDSSEYLQGHLRTEECDDPTLKLIESPQKLSNNYKSATPYATELFLWNRTVRDELVWEASSRSKLLVEVDAVLAVGIHEVWSFARPRKWLASLVSAFAAVLPSRWLLATEARAGTTYVLEPETGLTLHYSTDRKHHWKKGPEALLYRSFVRTCRATRFAPPVALALAALPDSLTRPVYTDAHVE